MSTFFCINLAEILPQKSENDISARVSAKNLGSTPAPEIWNPEPVPSGDWLQKNPAGN